MRAHGNIRVGQAGTILYLQPFDGIGIVAGPGLWHVVKHAWIKATATTGAALKENLWELAGEPFQYGIQSQDIAMHSFTLPVCRQCQGTNLCHMAIHIPFYIADRGTAENIAYRFYDVILYLLATQIQYQLVAASGFVTAWYLEAPLRMLAEQLAVLRDHLWLKPQAKHQTLSYSMIRNVLQTIWQLCLVHKPISQGGSIVIAMTKPAIIQDHQLNA